MTKRSPHALFLMLALLVGGLAGCGGSMRSATANEINCRSEDTDIIDPEEANGNETWNAQCRGHTPEYRCSRPDGSERVTCATVTESSDSAFE